MKKKQRSKRDEYHFDGIVGFFGDSKQSESAIFPNWILLQ